ncbi:hypothetical protein MA16_Dca004254 [Dendrobium catenatum]|uniref:Uncharacterized protein n=1 Tax=Dendrobium catenatum TaxID=906689 RepID=A0A2I0W6X5_9ASPA|nr:hypothetical protein MA16_Dca004254 [Dendrobium catenatum]
MADVGVNLNANDSCEVPVNVEYAVFSPSADALAGQVFGNGEDVFLKEGGLLVESTEMVDLTGACVNIEAGEVNDGSASIDVGFDAGDALLVPNISSVVAVVQVDEAQPEFTISPALGVDALGISGSSVSLSEECGGVNNVVSNVGGGGIVGNDLLVSSNSFINVPVNLIAPKLWCIMWVIIQG